MTMLKTGDLCPCCGQPIRSRDPDVLRMLSEIAEMRRFPMVEEIQRIVRKEAPDAQ